MKSIEDNGSDSISMSEEKDEFDYNINHNIRKNSNLKLSQKRA